MDLLQDYVSLSKVEKVKVIKFCLIILCYGLQCVQFTGVPIIFYRPTRLENPDPNGGPLFDSEFPQIYSIPMEYDLYGDNEIYEVIILTAGYVAKYFSYAFLILYPIKKSQTHTMFFAPIIAIGISLSMLQFYSSPQMLVFSFFVWFGASSYFFGQVFSYTATQFTGRIGDNYVIYLNTSWSIIMLFHIYFETLFGGWKENLIYFTGFSYLTIGIVLIYMQKYINKHEKIENELKKEQQQVEVQQKQNQEIVNLSKDLQEQNNNKSQRVSNHLAELNENEKEKQAKITEQKEKVETEESSFEMLKQIFKEVRGNKNTRNNIMIWAVAWSVCGVSYIGCVLALNRLKGNIFFNMFVSTLFELCGNFLSIYFIKNYKIKNIIINNLYVMGIAYVSFIFFNTGSVGNNQGEDETLLDIIISISPVIIAKATHETMWNMLLEFQKQIMDVKYHQFSFSIGNVYDIIIHSSLPYYQYSMEKLGYNQFIGYGIYSLFGAFCAQRFKLLPKYEDEKDKKDITEDVIQSRVSHDVELQTLTKQLIEKI